MSSYRVLLLIIVVPLLTITTSLWLGCSSSDDSNPRTDQAAGKGPGSKPVGDPVQNAEDPVASEEPGTPADAVESEQPAELPVTPEPNEPDAPSEPTETTESAPPETQDEPSPPSGAYDEPTDPPAPVEPADTPVKPADPPAPMVERPFGPVRVEPTREGLTDVGVERCQKCHKIQYTSWLETEHAKLEPPLDCEACHGSGSEYRSLKVMKDPEAARAAGLVDPSPTFCARCHVSGWDDEMLQRAHAHKSDSE